VLSANFLTYLTSEVKFYFFLGILAMSGMISALIADFFITPLLFKRFKIFGEEKQLTKITLEITLRGDFF